MMRELAYSCIFMKRIGWGYTHTLTLMPGGRLGGMEHWMAVRRAKPDYLCTPSSCPKIGQ